MFTVYLQFTQHRPHWSTIAAGLQTTLRILYIVTWSGAATLGGVGTRPAAANEETSGRWYLARILVTIQHHPSEWIPLLLKLCPSLQEMATPKKQRSHIGYHAPYVDTCEYDSCSSYLSATSWAITRAVSSLQHDRVQCGVVTQPRPGLRTMVQLTWPSAWTQRLQPRNHGGWSR